MTVMLCAVLLGALTRLTGAVPIGANLPPLGGKDLGGLATADVNWNPISTYVFTDLFKHCSEFYIRMTRDGGKTILWSSQQVPRDSNGYPYSIPYSDALNFHVAVCDIGAGGDSIRNGHYTLLWDGDGAADVTGAAVSYSRRGSNNSADVSILVAEGSTQGVAVRITDSRNPLDPVRNIRLVPTALELNYTEQTFQPTFLSMLKPFDHIRFTGWQKISSTPKNWTLRTKPSSQTQHRSDGVAAEHLVELLQVTGVRSIALSFPLNSDEYNAALVDFLARHLPSDTVIYFEAGSPEFHGDTNRAAETLALADRFDAVFGNIDNIRDDVDFTWRPFASVVISAYVPYLINWFGSDLSRLHSVAIMGVFGRSTFRWDKYSGHGIWDLSYADWSVSELLEEVENSVLVAEVDINTMIQRLRGAHPSVSIIAFASGPLFMANNYGYRAGKYSIQGCAAGNHFPCTWANTQYNFANQSEVDAALPMMELNATLEQQLQDRLIEVQRSPRIYDINLDFFRRWDAVNGGLLIAANLVQPALRCPTGGKGCGSFGLFERPPLDLNCTTSCAKYSSIVDFRQGIRGSIAYTSADLPVEPDQHACSATCEWGTCQNGDCVCFAGYTGASCDQITAKRTDCNSDTGINLAGVVDWSAEWPYVDIFKSARAWIAQDFYPGTAWETYTTQHLSATDYPSQLSSNQKLGSMMIRDLREHAPEGVYVVLYDGDGILSFSMDVVAVRRSVGRIEVTVVPSSGLNNGLFLIVERTNPADPIRNIRVFMPGYEHWPVPFHPFFLDSIKNYKVLRFMDWANTNGAEYSSWDQRSTRNGTRSYSGASLMPNSEKPGVGAPIEDMVLLANMVGAAPWFNIPHLADDDFVRRYAQLVHKEIRPDVSIYIEYSNEVWGTLFNGGKYAQQQGYAYGLADGDADARFCFYVKRSSELFSIWEDVFGEDASRLEFVYSSQSVNADVTRRMLSCSRRLDVVTNATLIAVAPYFGSYDHETDTDLDIFMNTTLPSQIVAISSTMKEHFELAQAHGMRLVTYESGQGLAGSGTNDDRAILANRDPRMSDLYVSYFDMLRNSNVSLMMQFSSAGLYSTSMCWGLMEASDQDPKNSPKYTGLQKYISKHSTCDISAFDNENASALCSFSGLYVEDLERCECYYGSSGSHCENNTYTEHTDLCGYYCYFNQGVCLPDTIVGTERYWACSCNEGYYGHQCQLFDCKDSCNYNGKCLDKDICSCFPGFTGEFCEVDCGCGGNGVCNSLNTGCVCDVGFSWSASSASCESLDADADGTCSGAPCENGVCVDNLCTCFAGYSGLSCDELSGSRPNQNSVIGTNLGGIAYWTTQWSFVDVMKMSSDWISLDYPGLLPQKETSWGNGMRVHLRDDGYPAFLEPGQILGKLMLRDVHYHAPAGRYTCLFDGDGVIEFGFDAKTVAIGKNRVEFVFTPTWREGCTSSYCGDNGIFMTILDTNRSNPIHNIRVIMPGFEAVYDKIPFHPWFLQNIEPYSVLRFMDWQHTNGNTVGTWAGRTLPMHDTQARSGGVALEHMIQLSNIVGASPWFCMPHLADDDYIRQFATTVRDNLRSDLTIYVEYSNEVWNGLFTQAEYASRRGLQLNLSTSQYTARYRFYSQRSVEIFSIWQDVFGSSASRLKRVLSTQVVSATATREILSWKNASEHADFLGVAPYFDCDSIAGPAKAGYTAVLSVEALISECNSSWTYLTDYISTAKNTAAEFGIPLITYEAGQALVETNVMQYGHGETAGLTALLIAANRHPKMRELYLEYLRVLNGMDVFDADRPLMSFASCGLPSKYGSWGTIEYTGQPLQDTPKYQALMKYFNLPEAACSGCSPNAVTLRSYLQSQKYTYAGHPAVLSPRYNDVWISGEYYTVEWFADTKESQLELFIHEIAADGAGLTEVWSMGYTVRASLGMHTIQAPPGLVFDGDFHFTVELRGESGSNFSDVFSIQSKYFFNNVTYVCCIGDMIPTFDTCLLTSRSQRSNARYHASSWTVNASVTAQSCSSPFPGWESSACGVNAYGCREYRTLRTGTTYGNFKPVQDCVAQTSPFPVSRKNGADDAGNSDVTTVPLNRCNSLINNYPRREDSCSVELGMDDQRCNISDPTQAPTVSPTLRPSFWPTAEGVTKRPTRRPSGVPTVAPSRQPTRVPSRQPIAPRPGSPTFQPTLAPTAQTFLAAQYKQNLEGVSANDFNNDPNAQKAFRNAVAASIGTNASSVTINNVTELSSARVGLRRLGSSSGLAVAYSISLIIQELDTQESGDALALIGSRMADSVSGGSFLQALKGSGGTGLFNNVTVSAPTFEGSMVSYLSAPPALSPTEPPSQSDDGLIQLTFAALVLIALSAAVTVFGVGALIFYYAHKGAVPPHRRKVQVSPRN